MVSTEKKIRFVIFSSQRVIFPEKVKIKISEKHRPVSAKLRWFLDSAPPNYLEKTTLIKVTR